MLIGLALIVAAASIGASGWSGEVLLLPVACLFPALWAFAPTRLFAGLVSMAYFMAASRGLPVGVSTFYATDMWLGLLLWVAASLLFVSVHTALWNSKPGWRKVVRYMVAAILMSVPPFGIVGWASPVTAAGVLFPGWGWLGLTATAVGLSTMTTQAWPVAGLAFGVAFTYSAAGWTDPEPMDGWAGIDTHFEHQAAGRHADYTQYMTTIALVRRAAESGADRIILPESALGIWTSTTEHLWIRGLADLDIVVAGGTIVVNQDGYDNVIVEVSRAGARILYRERMPVPVSMWQPWLVLTGQGGGAEAQFFANPIVEFAGLRVAPLICYEQLLVWPVLQSVFLSPDAIVAVGNGWWTHRTSIVAIQKAAVVAWAKLFDLPLIVAFNS